MVVFLFVLRSFSALLSKFCSGRQRTLVMLTFPLTLMKKAPDIIYDTNFSSAQAVEVTEQCPRKDMRLASFTSEAEKLLQDKKVLSPCFQSPHYLVLPRVSQIEKDPSSHFEVFVQHVKKKGEKIPLVSASKCRLFTSFCREKSLCQIGLQSFVWNKSLGNLASLSFLFLVTV